MAHLQNHGNTAGCTANAERGTRLVFWLTLWTMVLEIAAGSMFHSMALLADGWHMASHAGALGVAWFAYVYARRHQNDQSFAFGTGKVNALAGFASALGLLAAAGMMAAESALRLAAPVAIDYGQAAVVAALGLAVNLASAWLLSGHEHDHTHDHNLKAAYLHVLADALTSVMALAALAGGRYLGLAWLDPAMGLVGAFVVGKWALGLSRQSANALLDRTTNPHLADQIRARLEHDGRARVASLAVWSVGPGQLATQVALETAAPEHPDAYRALLADLEGLCRVSVEVRPQAQTLPSPVRVA